MLNVDFERHSVQGRTKSGKPLGKLSKMACPGRPLSPPSVPTPDLGG